MGLPKLEKDIAYISKLDDEPNDVGGLSAAELKERFDQAGQDIKSFINDMLIPYLEGISGASAIGIRTISGISNAADVQAALELLKEAIDNTATGAIPDGSLSGDKLQAGAISSEKIQNGSVGPDKIADNAISREKIANDAVNGDKIADDSIGSEHIKALAVGTSELADSAVDTGKIANKSVTANKIADNAVTSNAIAAGAVTAEKVPSGAIPRAKLGQDTRYSPLSSFSSRTVTADDIGRELRSGWNTDAVLTITQAVSTTFPVGATIAVTRYCNGEQTVGVRFTGTRFVIGGDTEGYTDALAKIDGAFYKIAVQKVEANSSLGDMWLVTGPVEVTA